MFRYRPFAVLLAFVALMVSTMHAVAQATDDIAHAAGSLNPWENWQIILAFVLPLGIQLITTRIHDRSVQAWAAFGVAVVVTVAGMVISGELEQGGFDIITTPLKVLVAVIAFYKGFWNPIGVTPSTGEAAVR